MRIQITKRISSTAYVNMHKILCLFPSQLAVVILRLIKRSMTAQRYFFQKEPQQKAPKNVPASA